MIDPLFWKGKKVLITGHTGFKGSWLALWLAYLGAEVTGYALEPSSKNDLFNTAGVDCEINSVYGNVLDYNHLLNTVKVCRPEIIVHMAAQSLVKNSYQDPVRTFATNVLGTVHVMDVIRHCDSIKVVVNVTSDKCYQNTGNPIWGYRENDPLGGQDPYSASKGCAELVASSYRSSFFQTQSTHNSVFLGSVRAGNVLGGGDWAADRLFPDIVRSAQSNNELFIRNPYATRPWQHVLDPLNGYLMLAEKLWSDGVNYSDGWNFGPTNEAVLPVSELLKRAERYWGKNLNIRFHEAPVYEEALYLNLDSSKAYFRLNWKPRLAIDDTIRWTVNWYRSFLDGENVRKLTMEQIHTFMRDRDV